MLFHYSIYIVGSTYTHMKFCAFRKKFQFWLSLNGKFSGICWMTCLSYLMQCFIIIFLNRTVLFYANDKFFSTYCIQFIKYNVYQHFSEIHIVCKQNIYRIKNIEYNCAFSIILKTQNINQMYRPWKSHFFFYNFA